MGKTLYLECYSGISGDMTVAALLDLGADRSVLDRVLKSLKVSGFETKISRVVKSGIDACDFDVVLDKEHENHDHDMEYLHGHHHEGHERNHAHGTGTAQDHHHHEHRGIKEITYIIEHSAMTENAKKIALRIFEILAEAESKAHNVPVDQVHFHEVGAVDSIVDIVSVAVCLDNLDIDQMLNVLNKQSGLLGICGTSDMRDVHANIEKGDEKAVLAFKMLTRSIKKVLGSYFFLLGNVDSIVFTAGIGENDEFVREAVCEGLEPFGIKVDKKENHTRKPGARVISTPDSRIPVLIIPTNEELEIATTTMRIVEESQK